MNDWWGSRDERFLHVNEILHAHRRAFSAFETIFLKVHSIPRKITRAEIKRRILAQLNGESETSFLVRKKKFLASAVIYYACMVYLLIRGLIGRSSNQVSIPVLFDVWSQGCGSFYEEIACKLPPEAIGILLYDNENDRFVTQNSLKYSVRVHRTYSKSFSRFAAWTVFRNHWCRFFFYWRLSESTQLDFVDMALRFFSSIATHLTTVEGLDVQVLVSANDNGFNPLRYHLYRSNGIGKIVLLQNGGRVNLIAHYNYNIFSDFYAGWSIERLDQFVEMNCKNKCPIGSIMLAKSLNTIGEKISTQYDLLFIEQVYNGEESNGSPTHRTYLEVLNNVVRFAAKHQQFIVGYCMRPGRETSERQDYCDEIDQILRGSRVQIINAERGESYVHITNARLIVACDSSMRLEALMMRKPVISCNYTKYRYDYVCSISEQIAILEDQSFQAFEKRTLYILDNLDRENIMKAYQKMFSKAGADNLTFLDPSGIVANIVKGIVEGSNDQTGQPCLLRLNNV